MSELINEILFLGQECFDIPVPKLKHHIREAQFASLHLQIQLNGTVYSGHTQDPLLIYPNHNVIFIETDKGFYKPHEKVKIRILVLTPELKSPDKYVVSVVLVYCILFKTYILDSSDKNY